MAGCCLYNDPIFPDWRGAIGFVCHTKRREAVRVQVDPPPSAHTPNPSIMASSHRLPVSTEALINQGQALAFVSREQKRRCVVNFCAPQVAAVKLCGTDWHSMKAVKRISDFNTANHFQFSLQPCCPCLWLILRKKYWRKKKTKNGADSHLVTSVRNHLENIN